MKSNLKHIIIVYIMSFIFMAIIVALRYNKIIDNSNILNKKDKTFFGVKNIWGYLHLSLYILLGYLGGLNLIPLVFIVSFMWGIFEEFSNDITKKHLKREDMIDNDGIILDTTIDMIGYFLGACVISYII